uniref:Transcription factor ABORTED MICROSPORES-like n=2 Tax=Cicer arietinum TaxID=3827 RepID=A0A1S3E4M2_CICAR|nr:transcription factor ABORTED MICROSPORES-like [Cicer arietinum]XP_027189166.1 transcription factor ABORTED MICROSPORES-like [Cicer arietinum]
MFSHSRIKACDLLSQLNTSISTDSGIHAQTLLANQPNWLNYPNTLDPNTLQETINGTHVLIPVPGGLVELFVTKQVGEDQQVLDFITSQCIVLVDQEGMNNSIGFNSMSNMQSNQVVCDENDGNNKTNNHFHPSDSLSLPPHDHISVMNFMQQFNYNYNYNQQNNRMRNDETFSEEYQGSFFHDHENSNNNLVKPNTEEEHEHKSLMTEEQYVFVNPLDSKKNQEEEEKDLMKHVVGRSDSMSDCSDQNEEEEDGKYRRRNGKGNQSKNLVAERKRRKKLNDRLYNLRSLVPRISKLDRASILGDAIEFVKDLQKQVKELQDDLEENSDTATESNCVINNQYVNGIQVEADNKNVRKAEHGYHVVGNGNEKQTQQMEAQVEVAQIDGNEYFVKVFCEHRAGGFVKLMEALNSLGMDVLHATVTSHKGLVSNVFKVEKKESEIVEAEDVRESLIELTRNR